MYNLIRMFLTKMSLKLILPLLLIFGFLSCQTRINKERIIKVDSVSLRMEQVAKVFLEIDTAKVTKDYYTILSNIDKVNSLGTSNNQDLFIQYGTLKKSFKEFVKKSPYTFKELEECRLQLKNLKQDIENNKITDSEFELYLKQEADASQNIRVQMSYYHERINSQIIIFEKLNPEIEILIDSLSKQK